MLVALIVITLVSALLHFGHTMAIRYHSDLIRRLDVKLAEHLELDDRYTTERSPGREPESTQGA